MRYTKTGGWTKWEHAITPRIFKATLDHHMRRASALNGKLAEKTIRQKIRAGGFQPNAPLTVLIKSSSKPLVDNSTGLFQAITSAVIDATTVFAGILQTSGEYNIALTLHEGATITVTPKMRGLFFWLWQASIGKLPPDKLSGRARELWERAPGGWFPLKDSTSHIVIPSRPFIEEAFRDTRMKQQAKKNWQAALKQTMRELAAGR